MATKQNPFEELFKVWTEQTQKFMQDPEIMKNMMLQFSKLQKEVFDIYEKQRQSSTSTFPNLSGDLSDSIIRLTNRINELEARIERLEAHKPKTARRRK